MYDKDLKKLSACMAGDLLLDDLSLIIYSIDASVYSEKPLAVECPKNRRDINKIIHFLRKLKMPIIRRTAGTSLAGQVVGNGIVVNVSRYMNEIWTELT